MESSSPSSSFTAEPLAFAESGRGALLLDIVSGALLELNESAAFVWKRRLRGEPLEAIADAFASHFSVAYQVAVHDVHRTLQPQPETKSEPLGDIEYLRTPIGYTFAFRGNLVFELDAHGQRVTLVNRAADIREIIPSLLRSLTPKLLALRGETVLHASAVEIGTATVAFAGSSGAGKTTTARSLVEAGAKPICEDQLLIRFDGSDLIAPRGGERAIAAWVAEAASELGRSGQVECVGLETISRGEHVSLKEIGFLDIQRRRGVRHASRHLRPWETAGLVFRNAFYGSSDDERWRKQLERAARIGDSVAGFELILPDGLNPLATTARDLAAAGTLRS